MRSPKFHHNRQVIEVVVTISSLKKQWKKLGKQLRSQLFLDVAEYKDIDAEIDNTIKELVKKINSGSYRPSKPTHYLVEKSRGLCRQMTQCKPHDLLVLEALTASLKQELVDNRPSKKAYFEPDDQAFSKKERRVGLAPYSSVRYWKDFQQAIFEFSKERDFIVVTDVANFYDFIGFRHLRNVISSICEVREPILDLLIFILNELSWTPDYMPRSEIGLPQMESNAPRVLANAMLYELDKLADERAFGDYARYMDDIDVGVDTVREAKETVRDIDLTLQARQLRLNSSKTKILTRSEAIDHFCIRENRFLDYCADVIDASNGTKNHIVKKALTGAYSIWRKPELRSSRFLRGNGDKIFKYTAKIASEVGLMLPPDDLVELIKRHPALRMTAFGALSRVRHPNREFRLIADSFHEGAFVDDYSFVLMAKFCIHTWFRNDHVFQKEIRRLIDLFLQKGSEYSVYGGLMMSSRFLGPSEVMDAVDFAFEHWKDSYWLGRMVGGLTPVCGIGMHTAGNFHRALRSANNTAAQDLYDFHVQLQTNTTAAKKLIYYAKANNASYSLGIIHPKALIIKSLSANPGIVSEFKSIMAAHPILRRDPFYAAWKL